MGFQYSVSELLAVRQRLNKPRIVGPVQPDLGDRKVASTFLETWEEVNFAIRNPHYTMSTGHARSLYKRKLVFQEGVSNNAFKRRWYRSGGTATALKQLPKHEVLVFDEKRLERFHRNDLERKFKKLDWLYSKLIWSSKRKDLIGILKAQKALEKAQGPVKRHKPPKGRFNYGAAHFVQSKYGDYISVHGGMTYTFHGPPPKGKWPKYWYFYRKNREWKYSTHHPIGDEADHFHDLFRVLPSLTTGYTDPFTGQKCRIDTPGD